METAMIGRDPDMDRAIACAARNLYQLERANRASLDEAHQLKLAARRLWAAARALPPVSKQLVRPYIRSFIIACKRAEHEVRIGHAVSAQRIHSEFARLVSEYRITRLDQQATTYSSDANSSLGHTLSGEDR